MFPRFAARSALWAWIASTALPVALLAVDGAPASRTVEVPVVVSDRPGDALRCAVACGPAVPVCALAFSPDGKRLAAGGYGEVLLWDVSTAELASRLGAGTLHRSIGALRFLKDGRLAIGHGSPGGAGAVTILAVDNGDPALVLDSPQDVVYSLDVSPDGKLLVAGGADARARVWSLEDGTLLKSLDGHAGWILDVAFSPDGKLLVTSSADRSAWVWDTATWEPTVRFLEGGAIQGARIAADGKSVVLAVGGSEQRSLRLRRTDNLRVSRPFPTQGGIPRRIVGAATTGRMYVPCSDGVIRVYEANGRPARSHLAGHDDWVHCAALDPGEKRLASGCSDGTVRIWSLATGRTLATLIQLEPRSDAWAIVTPRGYFTTSSPGRLRWLAEDGRERETPMDARLHDADRVRAALTRVDAPARAGARTQRNRKAKES